MAMALPTTGAKADIGPAPTACGVVKSDATLPDAASLRALQKRRSLPRLVRCNYDEMWQTGPTYFIASDVRRSPALVCSYRDVPIGLMHGAWIEQGEESTLYARPDAQAVCQKLGDFSYVRTSGVSEDDFLRVQTFWRDATSSPDRFDALFPSPRAAHRLREAIFQSGTRDGALLLSHIAAGPADYLACWINACFVVWVGSPIDFDRVHSIVVAIDWFGELSVLDVDRYVV